MDAQRRNRILFAALAALTAGIIAYLLLPLGLRTLAISALDSAAADAGIELNYTHLHVTYGFRVEITGLSLSRASTKPASDAQPPSSQLQIDYLHLHPQPLRILRGLLPVGRITAGGIGLQLPRQQVVITHGEVELGSRRGPRRLPLPETVTLRGLQGSLRTAGAPANAPTPANTDEPAASGTPPDTSSLPPLERLLELAPRRIVMHNAGFQLSRSVVQMDTLELTHDPAAGAVSIRSLGQFSGNNGSWDIDHTLGYRDGTAQGSSRISDINLTALMAELSPVWAGRIPSGRLSLQAESQGFTAGNITLQEIALDIPQLSEAPLGPVEITYRFRIEHDSSETVFTRGDAAFAGLPFQLLPVLHEHRGFLDPPERVSARIAFSDTRLQDIITAVPAPLLGELVDIRIDGSVDWELFLDIPTNAIDESYWKAEADFSGVYLHHIPDSLNVFRLRGPFLHRITDPRVDYDRVVRIGPMQPQRPEWLTAADRLSQDQVDELTSRRPIPTAESVSQRRSRISYRFSDEPIYLDPDYHFVPLDEIADAVPLAVVTAEDGEFFRHRGLNWRAVFTAVERNLREGEYLVGASTIPMQLIKNLFLDQSKVMSRKFQELILVVLMERSAAIPKERQLEIYLNIVEFGPGVFGIYDAAQYYFAKHPSELNHAEAVWLASILPSPKRYHGYYEAGQISDGWFTRMQSILHIMHQRERISDADYQQAIANKPEFAKNP